MKSVSGIIVPLVLAAVGIGLIVSFTRANESATRTSGWRQAAGTIDRVGSASEKKVAYRYTVDGLEHRAAQTITTRPDRYRAGQAVIVYVNPAQSTVSQLEPAPRPSPWQWIGGTFSLLLAATFPLYFRLAKRTVPMRRGGNQSKLAKSAPARKSAPMSRLRPPAPIKRNEPDDPQPSDDSEG